MSGVLPEWHHTNECHGSAQSYPLQWTVKNVNQHVMGYMEATASAARANTWKLIQQIPNAKICIILHCFMRLHTAWSRGPKTGWPSLNVVIFPPVMRLVLDNPKQWPPWDYWLNPWDPPWRLLIKSTRPTDFSQINGWATGHPKWAGWVHHSWRFGQAEALREVGPKMPERGSKTSTVPVVWATFGIFSVRFKWFPVTIGDHERNLVTSLWSGDNTTINGEAA